MSDKSEACPICGTPVNADVEEINKTSVEKQHKPENPIANEQPMKTKEEAEPTENYPPTPPSPSPSQPKPEQPKKKGKTGLIIGIVAGVLVIAAVIAVFVMKSNKEQALSEQQAEYEMHISEQRNQIEDELAKQVLEAYRTNTIYKIETPDFQAVRKEVDEAEDASGYLCIDWDFYYCTQDDWPDRFNVTRVDLINPNKANVYVELVFDRDVYRPKDTVVLVMVRASNEIESNWLVDDVGLGKNSIKSIMKEFTKSVLEEIDIDESPDLESRFVVIDGSELRLRLGPSTSYDTFKWPDGTNRHPNVGDKFKYLGESGDFYKIDFNGNEVWVSKQYTHLE